MHWKTNKNYIEKITKITPKKLTKKLNKKLTKKSTLNQLLFFELELVEPYHNSENWANQNSATTKQS